LTDASFAIPWLFVATGTAVSAFAGYRMRGPKGLGGAVAIGMLACVLGALLTVATVWAHSTCVEVLRACASRGDENLSYWMHSLVGIPVFWLLMLAFPGSEDRS